MKLIIVGLFILFASVLFAQDKKVISPKDYDIWKEISGVRISDNGLYSCYQVGPQVGDEKLVFVNNESLKKTSQMRGDGAQFTEDASFAVFRIHPQYKKVRKLKLKKTPSSKLPKDSLGIFVSAWDSIIKYPKLKSFDLPEKGNYFAWLSYEKYDFDQESKGLIFKKYNPDKKSTEGRILHLTNPLIDFCRSIYNVTSYEFSRFGSTLTYTTHVKIDTLNQCAVYYLLPTDKKENRPIKIYDGVYDISQLTISEDGQKIAFLASMDTATNKQYSLFYYEMGWERAKMLVDSLSNELPEGMCVHANGNVKFSRDGAYLTFGVYDIPDHIVKDTLLESEKYKLDIWSWKDDEIMPRQLNNLFFDKRFTYTYSYYLPSNKIQRLTHNRSERVSSLMYGNSDFVLVEDRSKYERENTYRFPWRSDYYLLNKKTGEKKLLKEAHEYELSVAPNAQAFCWYNGEEKQWYFQSLSNPTEICVTKSIVDVNWADDNNGSPYTPYSQGMGGWTVDGAMVLYSEYDIWKIYPMRWEQLTTGKMDKKVYRLGYYYPDQPWVDFSQAQYFRAYDRKDKSIEYYRWIDGMLDKIYDENKTLYNFQKAENSNNTLIQPASITDFPDVYLLKNDFTKKERLSSANPQQKNYNWATVEQVSWTSYAGDSLEGLLYKPENFDPDKKYPMIVYFYEKSDDLKHIHWYPKPTASIVYPTEYASNGYVVFIPNIHYTPGNPGQNAYDCIVSGTRYLTQKYNWLDSTKMGLQGQSWGGYQTAFLITQTNMYSAAMAGAPVSNMTSAYGGIRWGSGMSRQFQYERTQSRLGLTLWDSTGLETYIKNSPVFFADKVNTPLLIMHNDDDGAVPWYQGIEYYMALRRLDKEVYMLNYNGDEHNLMKRPNRVDLSIRMMQFFDYHLKGAPIPEWMDKGRPALEKEKNDAYKLMED